MMKEYWVNVYKYPKLENYCYSHDISSLVYAIKLQSKYPPNIRKVVYRIHVKLKEPIKPKWDKWTIESLKLA